jgi:membrane protein required for colicin V production
VSWIDYAIIAICVASATFGVWRGFVKEAIALVTWLLAILLAWQGSWMLEERLGEWTAAPELRVWTARIIIFVAILIVGGLLAWTVRSLIRRTGLSGTDRTLGAMFGLARGLLLVGLLAIVIDLAGLGGETWWDEARFRPFSEQVAEGIRYYAELGNRYIESGEVDAAMDELL